MNWTGEDWLIFGFFGLMLGVVAGLIWIGNRITRDEPDEHEDVDRRRG